MYGNVWEIFLYDSGQLTLLKDKINSLLINKFVID